MKQFNKIFLRLAEWFHPPYRIKYESDFPQVLRRRTIYVIGEHDYPWLLAFECPCGCKATIQLNLLNEATPKWKFQIFPENDKIDVTPSVCRNIGCKSHFFIRNGKIIWC
jgi:hypothetical protein